MERKIKIVFYIIIGLALCHQIYTIRGIEKRINQMEKDGTFKCLKK